MAGKSKAGADDKTVEGIPHDHGDGDKHHLHPLGNVPHVHKDGKAILLDRDGQPLHTGNGQDRRGGRLRDANGRFVSAVPAPDRRRQPRRTGDQQRWLDKYDANQARKAAVVEARQAARARGEVLPPAVTDADVADMERAGLLFDFDHRLQSLDDLADAAVERIGLEPGLVELAMGVLDHEVAALKATSQRLQDEVLGRSRFLVFAAAAADRGHHPAAAYCYVADRLDPAGTP